MATGPLDGEDDAGLADPEPELHPARSAAPARAVAADTPKRLRSTIGPPVSTPSDLRCASSRSARPGVRPVTCLENRSDVWLMSTPVGHEDADRHRNDMRWLIEVLADCRALEPKK